MQVDLSGISVMVAVPVFDTLPAATVRALLETQAACLRRGIALDVEMNVGSTVFHVRSIQAHRFLKGGCNRLFMIDADMDWTPDDFMRTLALSTKMDCVCGAYTARRDPPLFYISLDHENQVLDANEYGCLPIGGVGLGFTVVSRELIQKLADKAPRIRFSSMPGEQVPKIFRFDEPDGEARGEDMAFFSDVRALGYQVNLDPTLTLGHVGSKTFRASIMDSMKAV